MRDSGPAVNAAVWVLNSLRLGELSALCEHLRAHEPALTKLFVDTLAPRDTIRVEPAKIEIRLPSEEGLPTAADLGVPVETGPVGEQPDDAEPLTGADEIGRALLKQLDAERAEGKYTVKQFTAFKRQNEITPSNPMTRGAARFFLHLVKTGKVRKLTREDREDDDDE